MNSTWQVDFYLFFVRHFALLSLKIKYKTGKSLSVTEVGKKHLSKTSFKSLLAEVFCKKPLSKFWENCWRNLSNGVQVFLKKNIVL